MGCQPLTPARWGRLWNDAGNLVFAGYTGGGGGGVDDKNYVHNQVGASASWTVTHDLGKYPAVSVLDTGGSIIIPNVLYVDLNNVTLGFAAATSGKAVFN